MPVHNLPTFQHPDRLTEEADELGQEPKLDHLVAQLGVEGEVEQQAQGDVQQVLVVAGDQFGQLLDDVQLGLQAEGGVSKSVSNLVVVFMLSQPVWLCQGEQREELCSHG